MQTKTASSRMFSLVVLYDMHTSYFLRALDAISDQDAHNRLNTKANHIAWLTGSLVQQRFEIAQSLGYNGKQAADELFRDGRGIQDGLTYPPLSQFISEWNLISPDLRNLLINVTDEKLNSPFEMPGMEMSFYDLITFIIYREANCIGQIALWRRLMAYPALKYD